MILSKFAPVICSAGIVSILFTGCSHPMFSDHDFDDDSFCPVSVRPIESLNEKFIDNLNNENIGLTPLASTDNKDTSKALVTLDSSNASDVPTTPVEESLYGSDHFDIVLENGHYYSGIDFPPGIYAIEAIHGKGNVITKPTKDKPHLNLLMDTSSLSSDYGESLEYVNHHDRVHLPKGSRITVKDLTIRMSSDNAKKEFKPLKRSEFEDVYLTSGIYTSGQDFTPGRYDIVATYKQGNVYSTNASNGGINSILGINEATNNMYVETFHNVYLPEGVQLIIPEMSVKIIPLY